MALIAYETAELQLIPVIMPPFPPRFDTVLVDGISVANTITPLSLDGLLHWSRLDLYNSTSDTWTKPSIEGTRYAKVGSTLNKKNRYYSIAFDVGNGQNLVHWAKDGSLPRLTSPTNTVFTNTHRPQLAVIYDQIDSNQYRVSHSSNSADHRWLVHQDTRLYKVGSIDTLFGYRRVTETDENGFSLTYGFGEIQTDDGEHVTDYEHSDASSVSDFDSVTSPLSVMESERLTLPANGALSYYGWVFSSDDSLFQANYHEARYALGFYDTNGVHQFDLDTTAVHDSVSSLTPAIRTVTLSNTEPLSGSVKLRRITAIPQFSLDRTTWTNMVTMGRLSTPASSKRTSGRRGQASALGSITVTPNPFTGRALLTFNLPEESLVDLEIYSVSGERVQTLLHNEKYRSGTHRLNWQSNDLPNGAYLIKLRYNNEIVTCRSVLMR